MTKKKSSWPSSKTKPAPPAEGKSIGTELSTPGSDQVSPDPTSPNVVELRNLSLDKDARSSLKPALGSCLEPHHNPEWDTIRFDITGQVKKADLIEARQVILDHWPVPDRQLIAQAMLKLRALTASRNTGDLDLDLTLEAYAEKLAEYPADAVVQALNEAPDRSTWFPAWHELKVRLDYLTENRRLILNAIDRELAKLEPKTSVAGLIEGAIKR
jgi:hypothetical protein